MTVFFIAFVLGAALGYYLKSDETNLKTEGEKLLTKLKGKL